MDWMNEMWTEWSGTKIGETEKNTTLDHGHPVEFTWRETFGIHEISTDYSVR